MKRRFLDEQNESGYQSFDTTTDNVIHLKRQKTEINVLNRIFRRASLVAQMRNLLDNNSFVRLSEVNKELKKTSRASVTSMTVESCTFHSHDPFSVFPNLTSVMISRFVVPSTVHKIDFSGSKLQSLYLINGKTDHRVDVICSSSELRSIDIRLDRHFHLHFPSTDKMETLRVYGYHFSPELTYPSLVSFESLNETLPSFSLSRCFPQLKSLILHPKTKCKLDLKKETPLIELSVPSNIIDEIPSSLRTLCLAQCSDSWLIKHLQNLSSLTSLTLFGTISKFELGGNFQAPVLQCLRIVSSAHIGITFIGNHSWASSLQTLSIQAHGRIAKIDMSSIPTLKTVQLNQLKNPIISLSEEEKRTELKRQLATTEQSYQLVNFKLAQTQRNIRLTNENVEMLLNSRAEELRQKQLLDGLVPNLPQNNTIRNYFETLHKTHQRRVVRMKDSLIEAKQDLKLLKEEEKGLLLQKERGGKWIDYHRKCIMSHSGVLLFDSVERLEMEGFTLAPGQLFIRHPSSVKALRFKRYCSLESFTPEKFTHLESIIFDQSHVEILKIENMAKLKEFLIDSSSCGTLSIRSCPSISHVHLEESNIDTLITDVHSLEEEFEDLVREIKIIK